MRMSPLRIASLAMALAGPIACAQPAPARYDRDLLAARLASAEIPPGLVIGEFRLASPAVVDGDTIKVVGIEGTLRLLGIDTEETFKSDKDRRAYDEGFEIYLAKKQEGHDRPIKAATPMGMEAKHWAEDFFEGVTTVRLERDHPKELRGRYGRLLAYVMVEKDGRWLNYNVEAVRAGMSPYFSKYGYSRRFHDEFVQAQAEAQANRRGIWDPKTEHYPDYDLRLRWWDSRAEVIARFEEQARGREDWLVLTNWDSMDRLAEHEGDEVVVLATVGDIRPREGKRPARVMLSRRMFSDLPLIFFDDEVLDACRIEEARGEFVQVRGTVSRYVFRSRKKRRNAEGDEAPSQLQIQIKRPEQVTFVDTRPVLIAAGHEPEIPEPQPQPIDPDAPPPAPEPPDASTEDELEPGFDGTSEDRDDVRHQESPIP
ncbi:MAG: thermonuclease family protein [Myxococcales bacterium]|nr:thermonuclease family protein [Myxococcales bacterium]